MRACATRCASRFAFPIQAGSLVQSTLQRLAKLREAEAAAADREGVRNALRKQARPHSRVNCLLQSILHGLAPRHALVALLDVAEHQSAARTLKHSLRWAAQ